VSFRPTRRVPHEDGFLTEVARASWELMADRPVTQAHATTTFPERIRGMGVASAIDRSVVRPAG
jgi:dTDP-4-dehydrorhamnose 3,5-epimerase